MLPSRYPAILMMACVCAVSPAWATVSFMLKNSADSMVGALGKISARHEDTLPDIARANGLGFREIKLANPGVDTWLPGRGTEIMLPTRYVLPDTPRVGIVLNIPEMRLYYYPLQDTGQAPEVITHPIGVGRQGWATPYLDTRVIQKKTRPSWYPPESIREEAAMEGNPLPRVVGPGPDNPLGSHALYLGFPEYLIHGTNKPFSIGMRVSHGCVRMYPEHIVELFELVEPGTPVTLVHQGVKAGWAGDELYLEVHPVVGVPDEDKRPSMTEVVSSLVAATREAELPMNLDWSRVEDALATANGIPVAVASRSTVLAAGQDEFAD